MIYQIIITYLLIGVTLFTLLDIIVKSFAQEKDQYSFKMGVFIILLWPIIIYGFYKVNQEESTKN